MSRLCAALKCWVCATAFLLFFNGLWSPAASIAWTNTAGGNWNVASNWSPNQVPGVSDYAVITNGGTYLVNINVNASLSGFAVGGSIGTQTLALTNWSLTSTGPAVVNSNGRFDFSGSAVTPAGITVDGVMVSAGATLENGSYVHIADGGRFSFKGTSPSTLRGSVTNAGTIEWDGLGLVQISGLIHNQSNALIEIQNDGGILGVPGIRLINEGLIHKSSGLGTTVISCAIENKGIVEVSSGAIQFNNIVLGDGSSYIGSGTSIVKAGTLSGSFTSENLIVDGSFGGNGTIHGSLTVLTAQIGGSITNAGTLVLTRWLQGDASTLLHNLSGSTLQLRKESGTSDFRIRFLGALINDGTILKTNDFDAAYFDAIAFTNNGVVKASAGTIIFDGTGSGLSRTVLNEGCSFIGTGTNIVRWTTIMNGAFYSDNLELEGAKLSGSGILHGSLSIAPTFEASSSASIVVSSGALLEFKPGPSIFLDAMITNSGLIKFYAPTVMPPLYARAILHNLADGTIEVEGPVAFGASQNPRFINEGMYRKIGMGTNTIPLGLPFINNGTILCESGAIGFAGSLTNPAGTLAVSGGKITSTVPVQLPGGLVTGSGVLEAPSITSTAIVRPGRSNAVLTLSGNYTQQLGGILEFDIGGTTPGVDQSQVIIEGNAHVAGSLGVNLVPGYSPSVGMSNEVLVTSALDGQFTCLNGMLLLGENKRFVADYTSTNLSLGVIAAPDPVGPTLNIAEQGQVLVCWPTEFDGYDLQCTTNLSGTDWDLIPIDGNRVVQDPSGQSKLFRLVKEP